MGCSQGKNDRPTASDDLQQRMRHAEKQRGVGLPPGNPGRYHPHPDHNQPQQANGGGGAQRVNFRPEGGDRRNAPRPQREGTPAPVTPMRQVREYEASPTKPSGPAVIARHGDIWYGANIIKKSPDGKIDLCWDDGSYTIGMEKDYVYPISVGTAVNCRWGSDWYPAIIKQLGTSLDVTWSDGSHSINLPATSLRPQTYFPEADPTTPTNAGVFGRRAVLMPGDEVEVRQDGYWQPAVIHHVGDRCSVEMRGATYEVCFIIFICEVFVVVLLTLNTKQVSLGAVRLPETTSCLNKDLAG